MVAPTVVNDITQLNPITVKSVIGTMTGTIEGTIEGIVDNGLQVV